MHEALSPGLRDGIGLILDPQQHLLRIELDNPPGNRLGLAQLTRLHSIATALGDLKPTDKIRSVILKAQGPDFSHGANLSDPDLAGKLAEGRTARMEFARLGQNLIDQWARAAVPTIAVASGHVVGAGACLFFASDFRIASPTTQVRFPEIDRGMHLGWGIVPRLVSLLGRTRATRLALLAEPLGVQDLGDVLTVADAPDAAGLDLALTLAAKPPLAVRTILRTLRAAANSGSEVANQDAEQWADTLASEDFAEAMAAWFERRVAVWQGL